MEGLNVTKRSKGQIEINKAILFLLLKMRSKTNKQYYNDFGLPLISVDYL